MGRHVYKCEFGIVHRSETCRCIDSHIKHFEVRCDKPDEHRTKGQAKTEPWTEEKVLDSLTEPTLRDRLRESLLVQPPFGSIDTTLDSLEGAVKEWLLAEAHRLQKQSL